MAFDLRRWLFVALALALGYGAWRSYGAKGLLLALSMLSFWVLLHFTLLLRVLRQAAGRPLGMVPSVPALQARLKPGQPMSRVVQLSASLGRRTDAKASEDEHAIFEWTDPDGERLCCVFFRGRLTSITRLPPTGATQNGPPGPAQP